MNYAAKSVIGKRAKNEDACYIPPKEGAPSVPFVAVADGMGGHAAGATAAKLVIEGLKTGLASVRGDDPIGVLKRAVASANLDVFRAAEVDSRLFGMGSTLVCALLYENRFIAANVGDSRLYHFDGETIAQVTEDHSLVAMLLSSGAITPEEALHHPKRNLITRAMGLGIRVETDIFDRSWKRGDILLLCSDGLCGSVTPNEMQGVLSRKLTLEQMCEVLVKKADENGATDNITVVLARCEGGESA